MTAIRHSGFVAESTIMRKLLVLAGRCARSKAPVLITGETGTGKELVATFIHEESERRSCPFKTLNCSAIPAELFETELFGHARGSFTGAVRDHDGLAFAADSGTLFLDEVSELSLFHQAKLLRFLQTGEVRRVGEVHARCVDVRIIAATNTNLLRHVKEGKFRLDLFYRLAVLGVEIPPLRDHIDDVIPLTEHFVSVYGGNDIEIPEDVCEELRQRQWPGNVRELENAVRRMLALQEGGKLSVVHLPQTKDQSSGRFRTLGEVVDEVARAHIRNACEACGWNLVKAARLLGLKRPTLYNRLKKYGIRKPWKKDIP